ncbi:ATP-binding protein [Sulfuricurvum sp.]|uniref:sensor histidine kinase n=1 Tax=Sulfuricurvum sp. TaxID=2025608 RepID=UPI00262D51C2|nr:ATP-binding protein [Sulfuricurvum sp.]MDD2781076.1 ATP-binding protein [Sulfuricurvum sp.]
MQNNIFSKEVDALYRALPIALIATLFNAIIIALILKDQFSANTLIVWILLNMAVLLFRSFSYLRFGSWLQADSTIFAYRIYMIGIIASGLVWGSSVFYLLPGSSVHMMMLIIIVGGMVAGGVGSSSYRPESYIFYNLLVIGPYALHFMLDTSNATSWMVGTALLLFSIMMILSSKKFHANFSEVILLQLKQQELVHNLEEEKYYTQHLNENLLQEIIEKEKVQTELINALEEARQAALAKDAFFATMSHELRTPLNAIIGFSQILTKRTDTPNEFKTYIDKILISGKHLLDLVNTILDFSKMKAGKMELNRTTFMLSEMLRDVAIMSEPLAAKRHIHLTFPHLDTTSMNGDRKMIQQILINILSNAIKFSPENSSVTLTYECNEDHLFTICDQGIGIAPEHIATIFAPFSQIEGSSQNAIKGTGLGLAIVKEMVQAHHGKIWATSTLGKGSCFYFSIPQKQ